MPELPSGTVTFCFTDIEGSTRLFQQLGDRYPDLLAEHHRILRDVFGANDGAEIKTEGDSFFVAFSSARDAVAACLDVQRRLTAHPWPDGVVIRVRIGLHTGEATPVDGDYVALAVHRAARIEAAAHGGQTLVSAATASLLDSSVSGTPGASGSTIAITEKPPTAAPAG